MNSLKNFMNSFKKYIEESNFIDVAIGLLIANSIKDMTNAFFLNIVTPILNKILLFLGIENINNKISLFGMNFGITPFIVAIINFLSTLFIAFLIIQIYSTIKHNKVKEDETEVELLKEILEELKKNKE